MGVILMSVSTVIVAINAQILRSLDLGPRDNWLARQPGSSAPRPAQPRRPNPEPNTTVGDLRA